jgi:hypothetical protein
MPKKMEVSPHLVYPTFKSHKSEELDVIWEVIQKCSQMNPQQRLTMREVTTKLNEILAISPKIVSPRRSPLWWTELEILLPFYLDLYNYFYL